MKYLIIILFSLNANAAIVTTPLTNAQLREFPLVVSGTFSAAPASGSATSALQVSGNSLLTDISSKLTAPLSVSGSISSNVVFPSSQSVNVLNFPSVQQVSQTGVVSVEVTNPTSFISINGIVPVSSTGTTSIAGSITVLNPVNSVSVSNFPSTQNVSGIVNIINASIPVTGTFFQATQPVSLLSVPNHSVTVLNPVSNVTIIGTVPTSATGTTSIAGSVSISNFPSIQNTSGTVQILNFPASQAVTGTFFQAIQPVSTTGINSVSGNVTLNNQISGFATSALQTTGNASTSSIDSKIPTGLTISGTRLLVELPASGGGGLTNGELRASPVSVSTTGTIAVSGFITVSNPQSSVSITGTPNINITNSSLIVSATAALPVTVGNFPSIQNVSGSFLTDTQIRATPLSVSTTGINSVSGFITVNNPQTSVSITGTAAVSTTGTVSTNGLTDAQLRASAVNVSRLDTTTSGTVAAVSQTVVFSLNGKSGVALQITGTWVGTMQFEATIDGTNWVPINGVVAGTSTPGTTTTANGIVRLTPSGVAQVRVFATAWTSGTANISFRASDGGGGTFLNQSLTAGTNSIGTVQAPTITKGTQGTTGFSVQQLHNGGRDSKFYSATFTAATTEALVSMVPITNGVSAAAATSFAVTAGKRLRIQSVCASTRNAGAAGQGVVIQLRMTATGAVVATSVLIGTTAAGTFLAVANVTNSNCITLPDGFELSGTQQFGVTQVGSLTANNTVVVQGFEY